MRHPAVLTTLAEDLRAIGLLTEDDEKDAPKPSPEGGYSGEADAAEKAKHEKPKSEQTDDDDEKEPKSEQADDEKEEPTDEDVEAAKDYVASLSRSFLKSHEAVTPGPVESRKPSGKKPVAETKSKPAPAKPKPKPKTESRTERVYRLAKGQIFESKTRTSAASAKDSAPTSRVAKLLSEVNDIIGGIHRAKRQEQIKGFANVAVVSEMLSRRFNSIAMGLSEGTLYKVAGAMKRLGEQASDMAVALDTPPGEEADETHEPGHETDDPKMATEQDDVQVDALFKKLMAKLLDALQLYNDVTGKEEPAAEGDEEPDDKMPDEPAAEGDEMPGDDKEKEEPTAEGDDEDDDEEPEDEPATPPVSPEGVEGDDEDDDEEEPKAEGEEKKPSPYGQPADERAVEEAKKALRRVLGKKKKLMAGKMGKAGKGKGKK
jgi:hypothetical protein